MPKPPSEDPKPKRPGWNSGRPQDKPDHQGSGGWRKGPKREAEERDRKQSASHVAKSIIWLAASICLVGGLAYLLWNLLPRRAAVLAVAVDEYRWPWAPNGWAAEDVKQFHLLNEDTIDFRDESGRVKVQVGGLSEANLTGLVKVFSDFLDARRPPIGVFYLSAHGAIDDAGEPCLIPAAASPVDPAKWFPLKDLLKLMGKEKWAGETPVLLVLDCGKMDVCWQAGILYNGFVDKVQDAALKDGFPKLTVLCSSGSGERAWASPHLQGSAFGHYFMRGLSGDADSRIDGGNEDGWVTLQELGGYLERRVPVWAVANRGDSQRPVWIHPLQGRDDSLRLVRVQGSGIWGTPGKVAAAQNAQIEAARAQSATASELDWDRAWSYRARLQAISDRVDPVDLSQWEQKLIWAEEAVFSGPEYAAEGTQILNKAISQADAWLKPSVRLTKAFSLPTAQRFELWSPSSPPKPDNPKEIDYYWNADQAFQQALRTRDRAEFPKLAQQPGALPEEFRPGVIEHHYLRMLARYAPAAAFRDGDVVKSLEVRSLAEQSAAPPNLRAVPFVRTAVDRADEKRRLAEDHLFVGETTDLDEARRGRDQSERAYNDALVVGREISAAYALRDRAWAELPYYALWLSRPSLADTVDVDAERNRLLDQVWTPGIESAHRLTNLLLDTRAGEATQKERKTLEARLAELQQKLDSLSTGILRSQGGDQQTLRQITGALAAPMVDPKQRGQVRNRWWEVSRTLQQSGLQTSSDKNAPPPGGANTAAESRSAVRVLGRLNYVPPLLQVVLEQSAGAAEAPPAPEAPKKEAGKPGEAAKPAGAASPDGAKPDAGATQSDLVPRLENVRKFGTAIREAYRKHQVDNAAMADQARQALNTSADGKAVSDLLAKADAAARRRAAFLSLPASGVTETAWRFQVYQFLLWQAQRTVLDAWGPAPPTDSLDTRDHASESFFIRAAEEYLYLAKRSFGDKAPTSFPGLGPVETMLDAQRQTLEASPQLAVTTPPPILGLADSGVVAGVEHEIQLRLAPNLPEGTAAVAVQNALQEDVRFEADGAARLRAAVPLRTSATTERSANLRVRYSLESFPSRLNAGVALCMFRGHVRAQPFSVTRTGKGIELTLGPAVLDPPRMIVNDNRKDARRYVFLLDCSESMLADSEGEGGRKLKRLDVARNALLAVLNNIAKDNRYPVSVYLFGHRVQWLVDKKNKFVVQPRRDWPNPIPGDVVPGTDVELVFASREKPFDLQDYQQVKSILDEAQPTGQTPLYFSLKAGITHALERRSAQATKSVVLILTDGQDEVLQVPGFDIPIVNKDDVLKAAGDRVLVNIVGFELSEKDRKAAIGAFNDIAKQTGGKSYDARNASSLAQSLQDSLDPGDYKLFFNDKPIASQRLGRDLDLDPAKSSDRLPEGYRFERGDYAVRVRARTSDPFELLGGEVLDLEILPGDRGFFFRPDSQSEVATSPPLDDPRQRGSAYVVSALQPLRNDGTITLPIAVRSAVEGAFSRSPRSVWLEVTPAAEGAAFVRGFSKYILYDLRLKNGRTYPICEFKLPNWPEKATQADVRVWFQFVAPQGPEMAVHEALDPEKVREKFGLPLQVKLDQRDFEGSPRTFLDVVHGPSLGDPYDYKLEMVDADRWLLQTSRGFDEESKTARHRFVFRGDSEQVRGFRLRLIKQSIMKDDAVYLRDPLRIVVPKRTAGVGG